jgi:hypothetical protein
MCGSLTLTLRPGVYWQDGSRSKLRIPKNMKKKPEKLQLPLMSGSRKVRRPGGDPFYGPDLPQGDSHYIRTGARNFVLPVSRHIAERWYWRTFRSCGFKQDGWSSGCDGRCPPKPNAYAVDYTRHKIMTYPEVSIAFRPVASAKTVVEYYGQDVLRCQPCTYSGPGPF